jgi:hypothetical protein
VIAKQTGPVLEADRVLSDRGLSAFVVRGDRRRVNFAIARRECTYYPANLSFWIHLGATGSALTYSMAKKALHVDAATRCAEITYWEVATRRRVARKRGEKRKRKQQASAFKRGSLLQRDVL